MQKTYLARTVAAILLALTGIQLLRMVVRYLCYLYIPKTMQTDRYITGIYFILALIVIALKANTYPIHMMPNLSQTNMKAGYATATAVTLLLMVSGLLVTRQLTAETVVLLVYGAVLTPVFEETLFRGVIWGHLEKAGFSKGVTYTATTVLFGPWHIGYIDTISWRIGDGNLL